MEHRQDGCGGKGRPERGVAGERTAEVGADDDGQDDIEGRHFAECALAGEPHEQDAVSENDDGADDHLPPGDLRRIRADQVVQVGKIYRGFLSRSAGFCYERGTLAVVSREREPS